MNSKYFLTPKIKPNIDKLGNVAFAADDVLFDWTSFEIPKGTCSLKTVTVIVPGTNAVAANAALDMDIYFAKSIDGVAPPTLGATNAAMNVISATAAKPYIIAYHPFDGSEMEDLGDGMKGFNVLSSGFNSGNNMTFSAMLEGEPSYPSTEGYQTIWVCGVAQGAYDFGTDVLVAGAHTDTDDLTIVVDGTPGADDCFAVGDELIAFANDGSSEQVIGTLTAVADNLITVDAVAGALADDDEVCLRQPLVFRFGLEY
tara:strand:+ start:50 stop:820 length:771 start_codon:yes stop_codon:yes gene_type:complete